MNQDIAKEYLQNAAEYRRYLKNIKNDYIESITVNEKTLTTYLTRNNTYYYSIYTTSGSLASETSAFSMKLKKIPKRFIISTDYDTVQDRNFGYTYYTALRYPETGKTKFILHRVHPYYNSLIMEVNGKKDYIMSDFPSHINETYDFETNISNLDQACTFAYYDENIEVNNKYPERVYFSHFELIF